MMIWPSALNPEIDRRSGPYRLTSQGLQSRYHNIPRFSRTIAGLDCNLGRLQWFGGSSDSLHCDSRLELNV